MSHSMIAQYSITVMQVISQISSLHLILTFGGSLRVRHIVRYNLQTRGLLARLQRTFQERPPTKNIGSSIWSNATTYVRSALVPT